MTGPLSPLPWGATHRFTALSVAGMLFAHGFYWIATKNGALLVTPHDPLWAPVRSIGAVVAILPMLLPFAAGIACRMRLPGVLGRSIGWRLFLVPGAFLFLLNGLTNAAAGGWRIFWAWNVLALVAVAFLITGLVIKTTGSAVAVGAVGIVVLVASDTLRGLPFTEGFALQRIILGDRYSHHVWPVIPWLSTFLLGFSLAALYRHWNGDARFSRFVLLTGIASVCLAAGAGEIGLPILPGDIIGTGVMMPKAVAVLGLIGVALVLLFVLPNGPPARGGFVHAYSAGILPIYVVHMIVGGRLARTIDEDLQSALLDPVTGPSRVLFVLILPALLLVFSWVVGRWWIGITALQLRIELRKIK